MSSRPRITKYPVIVDGDMSQASITSAVSIIQDLTLVGYSYSWSGSSPAGDITVEVSNDYALSADGKSVLNAGTWNVLTLNYGGSAVTSVPVSGNSGSGFVDIQATSAYAIRTVYTQDSGTGTLQAIITSKVA